METSDKSVTVHLYAIAGAKVFVGRNKEGNKSGIVSVAKFNRKMIYMYAAAEEGCPFARKAITRIETKIEAVRQSIISRINVLDGKAYSAIADARELHEKFSVIRIECRHFNSTTNKLMNTLVFYDELYLKLIVDEYKKRGRVRKFQGESAKFRRKIRTCMSYALEYQDFGFRGLLTDNHKKHKGYKKMLASFGEIEQQGVDKLLAYN